MQYTSAAECLASCKRVAAVAFMISSVRSFAACVLVVGTTSHVWADVLDQPGPGNSNNPQHSQSFEVGVAKSGVVRSLKVGNGTQVKAGQVLLYLDCRPLEQDIAFRKASLAAAEAVNERVTNGPRREEVAIGEAGVGVAKARAEEARAALDRATALKVGVTVTKAQLLQIERDSRVDDAQLIEAQKRLALLRAGSRVEDIKETRGKRDAAAALLEQSKAELDQCTVRAPIDGVVELMVTPGQFVSSLIQEPLARVHR